MTTNMQEFFMTATVPECDCLKAQSLLQGYTGMSELHTFTRIIYYMTPAGGLPALKATAQQPGLKQWEELNKVVKAQPYIVQARFEVGEAAFETGQVPFDTSSQTGLVRWYDVPFTTSTSRVPVNHTHRRTMDIRLPNIERTLVSNDCMRKSEAIEERYSFWLEGVEYALVRSLHCQAEPPQTGGAIPNHLPPASTYQPLVPFWILYVRTQMPDGGKPEEMTAGREQMTHVLESIRRSFAGLFEFVVFDRLFFDTRIMQQKSNMPAPLPQVVRA